MDEFDDSEERPEAGDGASAVPLNYLVKLYNRTARGDRVAGTVQCLESGRKLSFGNAEKLLKIIDSNLGQWD